MAKYFLFPGERMRLYPEKGSVVVFVNRKPRPYPLPKDYRLVKNLKERGK